MATTYSNFEKAVAQQVIQSLQDRINLYLGTSTTKGEVRTRDIGLYEKKTFKTLLEYYAERAIYERDSWFAGFGRCQMTEVEIKNVTAQVHVHVLDWLKDWDKYHDTYSDVRVSDIRGKRSKIIRYSFMLSAGWKNIKGIIKEEAEALRTIYKKHVIYSFTTSEERLELEERYPDKQFIDVTDFRKQLLERALSKIGTRYEIEEDLFNSYVKWTSDVLEEESSESILWEGYTDDQKETVKTHHQSFIDYVTLQVFGDRGYLFGIERENVLTSIAIGNQPSMSDFQDFMLARAESEAHRGEYGLEGTSRHEYSPSDVELVKKLNQRFVNEVAITRYNGFLEDNEIIDNDDNVTGTAFGYKIPNSEILKRIEDRISDATLEAWENMGEGASDEDVISFINDAGKEEADDIDDSFVDPYTSGGYNKYRKNYDTYKLKNSPVSTAEDPGDTYVATGRNKYVRWKRDKIPYVDWTKYKTPGYSYKERTYNWERYHGSGDVASKFTPTYRTFSGHDMVVTVQLPISRTSNIVKVIGAFQTITYSIHNDKSPVRVLGDMNVRRYVFGPRTVAGTLILTVFDRHWMKELLGSYKKIKGETERYFLMDELPAFNLTISCANEYGHSAKLALYGVTIVNEGQVMSINDVYTENTYQFFATNIEYLDRVEKTSNGKKTATTNLPIKSQTQGITSDTNQSAPATDAKIDNGTSSNGDPLQGDILEGVDNLDNYDNQTLRQQYYKTLEDLASNADTDGDEILSEEEQASVVKSMNELARKESNRRVEVWKEKIYFPKLKKLEKDHQSGKLTDEQYSQMKHNWNASMVLNTVVILKSEYGTVERDCNENGIDYKKYESLGVVNGTASGTDYAEEWEEAYG